MDLQKEIESYLKKFGITKAHMADVIGIHSQQLSSWFSKKLVLSNEHMRNIKQYGENLKILNQMLVDNNIVL